MPKTLNDVTENELAELLKKALEEQQAEEEANTITTIEFADAIGLGRQAALRRLKRLQHQGVVKRDRIQRYNIDGVLTTIGGWRYVAD